MALETYIPSSIDQLSVPRDIAAIAEENEMLVQSIAAEEVEGGSSEEEGGVDATADPDATLPPPDPALADPALADPALADPALVDPLMAGVGAESLASEAERELVSQRFSVTVIGTYDQMKAFLVDLERNDYPLRLTEFDFSVDAESQLYTFEIAVETYALQTPN